MIATVFEQPEHRYILVPIVIPTNEDEVRKGEEDMHRFLPGAAAAAQRGEPEPVSLYKGATKMGDVVDWFVWPQKDVTLPVGSANRVQKSTRTFPAGTGFCGLLLTWAGWNEHVAGTLSWQDLTAGRPR